ncbi:hypothetical protein M8J71_20115 [Pseudarthrobacter sp. R1]|uniref:hypothetical protein n=1 Tax=Pseudarthrobacter sp. R1 TaxID=2944934 RepID=UPI00210CED97|nr:hypothetical protein [Pseudarthrobacter sp. R1]MCQ6272766.1 hypothetical protein [Pseudarthrobacter sp. R1]
MSTPSTLPLTDAELDTLWAVADVLVPATETMPSLRQADPDSYWLARALDARSDIIDNIKRYLQELGVVVNLSTELIRWHSESREDFDNLAAIVAGTYYMVPRVRELIGYPGQERRPAPVELAADELSDDIFEGAMAYEGKYREA